jgi:ribosomal protein S18 acetylase RimI-like enzyme
VSARPARPDEAELLSGLAERAYTPYVARIGRRPAPMDDDYAARVRNGQAFVAEVDGVVAGVIVLVPGDGHLFIENVAVEPSRQGGGIGRALLDFAEQRARQLGLPELRLYTNVYMTENLAMYPRLGYHETGRRREHGFERVYFSRRLWEAGMTR